MPYREVSSRGAGAGGRSLGCAKISPLVPSHVLWGEVTPLDGARGRGGAGRLALPGRVQAFARTARRGGALRRVLPPEAFFGRDRVFRELAVGVELGRRGVAVATPLAALARPHGLAFPGCDGPPYRLRFITEEIEGVLPLPAFVTRYPEHRREAVERTGALVADAFAAGLQHRDLHPDNVVASVQADGGVRVWLLDLDRASLAAGPLSRRDTDKMLLRMARYMVRHRNRLAVHLSRSDVLRFLRAFGLEERAAVEEFARLVPALDREVTRHGLRWRKG